MSKNAPGTGGVKGPIAQPPALDIDGDMSVTGNIMNAEFSQIAAYKELFQFLPWIKQQFEKSAFDYTPLPPVLWEIVKQYLNDNYK